MKKLVGFIMLIAIIVSGVTAYAITPERITILINGEQIGFANPPIVENGEVLVPIRQVVDHFGAELSWDSHSRTAVIVNERITITISADSYEIVWSNGEREEIVELTVPTRIHGGSLFVPAHDIVAALDYTFEEVWDFATSFSWGTQETNRYLTTLYFAEHGFVHSQYELGVLYEFGWYGARVSLRDAYYWYSRAAENGHPIAQNNLGMMYRNGVVVRRSESRANYWFRKAAAQGEPNAEFNLGSAYYFGRGEEIDHEQALYWYTRAAEQGHDRGMAQMGYLYMGSDVLGQDFERAVYWSRRAAELGLHYAQNNMGYMYSRGLGVELDYSWAIYWLTRAAAQGNTVAPVTLANISARDIPSPVSGEISGYGRQVTEEFLRGFASIFSDDYDVANRDAPYVHWGLAASDFRLFDLTGDGIPEVFILWEGNEIWHVDGTYSIEDHWHLFAYVDGDFVNTSLVFTSFNFYYDRGEILSAAEFDLDGELKMLLSHVDIFTEHGFGSFRSVMFSPIPFVPEAHLFPIPQLTELRGEIYESILEWRQENGL